LFVIPIIIIVRNNKHWRNEYEKASHIPEAQILAGTHGFILTEEGWVLSPAYDLNPSIDKDHLSLNIDMDDSAFDILDNTSFMVVDLLFC
jgi:hypothetical protein